MWGLSCSTWDLWSSSWCVGSSSLARDWTQALRVGTMESWPLDRENPSFPFLYRFSPRVMRMKGEGLNDSLKGFSKIWHPKLNHFPPNSTGMKDFLVLSPSACFFLQEMARADRGLHFLGQSIGDRPTPRGKFSSRAWSWSCSLIHHLCLKAVEYIDHH